jgi:hypothetical protein
MDRSTSPPSHGRRAGRPTIDAVPPWERRDLKQVPFVESSSPVLSNSELRALPDLWAVRSTNVNQREHERHPSLTGHRGFRDEGYDVPRTALPLQASSTPYETPVYIPPAPKTAPPLPKYVQSVQAAPPTPPESISKSSDASSAAVSPPAAHAVLTALPGTMSSRDRKEARSRTRGSHHTRSESKHSKAESVSFGSRFKAAFKDMFKRNPIDETQFERIEDRHWTDEY